MSEIKFYLIKWLGNMYAPNEWINEKDLPREILFEDYGMQILMCMKTKKLINV